MNEEAAFIAALVKEPSDKTAALVFADWLDEHSDLRGPMMRIDEVRAWMAPDYANPLPKLRAAIETGKRITDATKALALIGEAAIPELLSLMSHKTPIVRSRAAKALRFMGPRAKSALPALLALGKDKDGGVRYEAFATAEEIAKSGAVETSVLREALQDADANVRSWAARLLGAARATGAMKTELAKELDNPDVGERLAALNAMSNLYTTAATASLCKALSDPSDEVRRAAAKQIARAADARMTRVVEPLHKALADPDAEVRSSVMSALANIGPAASVALPELLRLLRNTSDSKEWSALLSAVARIGVDNPEVLEVVLAALPNPTDSVRSSAIGALAKWTALPPSAAPALLDFIRIFNGKSWSHEYPHAVRALARIDPKQQEVWEEFRAQLAGSRNVAVVQVLGELGPAASPLLPEVIAVFRAGHIFHLNEVAKALGKIGSDGIAALVEALDSGPTTGYNPRLDAAIAGLTAAGPAARAALPTLLARLREPSSSYVRFFAARTIVAMGTEAATILPDLIAMYSDAQLPDPHDSVRVALEGFGPALLPFVPRLTELLRQPAKANQHASVIRLLTSLVPHGVEVLDLFREVLQKANAGDGFAGEPTRRVDLARAVIRGLAALGRAAAPAFPELALAYRTFGGSTDGDTREAVLDAYGEIGGPAIPEIIAALPDSSWKIRLAAVKALGETGDASAETLAALRSVETDASSKVRTRAAAIVKKLETSEKKRTRTRK